MSGHPLESRQLVEDALATLARGQQPVALALTLELAIDHYWRGEFEADARGGGGSVAPGRADRGTSACTATWAGALCSLASTSYEPSWPTRGPS